MSRSVSPWPLWNKSKTFDRCIVEYPIKIKLIAQAVCSTLFLVFFCFSCMRRRGGCGVPSTRHGVLRYVRIIQHAYTVIQLNYQIPRVKHLEKEFCVRRISFVEKQPMKKLHATRVIVLPWLRSSNRNIASTRRWLYTMSTKM